jgi:hypothetical protein
MHHHHHNHHLHHHAAASVQHVQNQVMRAQQDAAQTCQHTQYLHAAKPMPSVGLQNTAMKLGLLLQVVLEQLFNGF